MAQVRASIFEHLLSGGFLKLSSDGLKPIAIHSPPGPLMGGVIGGMTTPTTSQNSSPGSGAVINNDSKRDNPFLQFVANARYVIIVKKLLVASLCIMVKGH